MRTSIKTAVATLGMVAVLGTANAGGMSTSCEPQALDVAIAAQTEQTLTNMRAEVLRALSQSTQQQLAAPLGMSGFAHRHNENAPVSTLTASAARNY